MWKLWVFSGPFEWRVLLNAIELEITRRGHTINFLHIRCPFKQASSNASEINCILAMLPRVSAPGHLYKTYATAGSASSE